MPRLSLSLQDVLDCTHTSRLSRESLSVLDAFRPFLLPAVTAAFSSTPASCRSPPPASDSLLRAGNILRRSPNTAARLVTAANGDGDPSARVNAVAGKMWSGESNVCVSAVSQLGDEHKQSRACV